MTEGEQAMDARTNRARDRLAAAETFVREALRLMGQPADADDPWLVRAVALRALDALPEPPQAP